MLDPIKKAMTSVKVVIETATPACFIVWPNLSSRLAGVEDNSEFRFAIKSSKSLYWKLPRVL